nr:hypothetical protein [Morchella crassipes]
MGEERKIQSNPSFPFQLRPPPNQSNYGSNWTVGMGGCSRMVRPNPPPSPPLMRRRGVGGGLPHSVIFSTFPPPPTFTHSPPPPPRGPYPFLHLCGERGGDLHPYSRRLQGR